MKSRAVTLNDIAKKLNVSTVTVSKALRDHPDISTKTARLIRQVAGELGYTPNYMARNLSARKSNTIGVILPKIAHFFFGSIIEVIYDIGFKNNYEIILTVSQESAERERKHIQTLMAMKVDGIILSVTQQTTDYAIFNTVKQRGFPIVFIDRVPAMDNINTVTVDDFGGAFRAVEQFIKTGHKKIGHIGGYTGVNIGKARYRGYRAAMEKYNLPVNDDWNFEGGYGEEYGEQAMKQIYALDDRPDAVLAVTYPVALGMIKTAKKLGVQIPDDLDLICFGNDPMQELIQPALSCVDQPTDEIAIKAMEILLNRIKEPDQESCTNHIIDTDLVLRETCVPRHVEI